MAKKKKVEAGFNINTPSLVIRHKDLKRIGDSPYRSKCPVCTDGILFLRRDPDSGMLLSMDNCIYCGQRFIYEDSQLIDKRIRKATVKIDNRPMRGAFEKLTIDSYHPAVRDVLSRVKSAKGQALSIQSAILIVRAAREMGWVKP